MNTFLMEMDAKNRYKDFQREANLHRLSKQLKAQRRARRNAMWRSLAAVVWLFVAGGAS